MSLSISINGEQPVSFEELGIIGSSLELSNQAQDRMVLTLARDLSEISPFPPYGRVILFHDGVQRFVGWVDQEPIMADHSRQQWQVVIFGPWRWLDLTNFSQQFKLSSGILSPKIQVPVLNQGVDENGSAIKIPISEVIADALNQVTALYGGVFSYVAEDLNGLDYQLPWSEKQNTTCGSVVRDQLAWVPGHSVWWDYSQQIPTLRITATPVLTSHQVLSTGIDSTSLSLNPRFDLLVRKVAVNYIWSFLRGDNTTTERSVVSDVAIAGAESDAATLGAPGEVNMSFSLQQGESPPVPGIAAAYLSAVSKLSIQTDFAVVDESGGWQYGLGELWGFAGIASRWSAYTSILQSATRDLFTKELRLRLGPPTHLGLQQIFALNRKNPRHVSEGGGGAGQGPQPQNQGPNPVPQTPGTIMVTLGSVEGSLGDLADLQEANAGTVIRAIGPGGITRQATPSNGQAVIQQCPPGQYTLDLIPPLGWKYAEDCSENKRYVTINSGSVGHGALFITRTKFASSSWEIIKSPAKSNSPIKVGVYYNSTLFKSVKPGDTLTVTGLLGRVAPSYQDPGWMAVTNESKIYLEVTLSNGIPTSATVKSTGAGATFDVDADSWTSGSIVEDDGGNPPQQTVARKLIAEVTVEGTSVFVEQHVVGSLTMCPCMIAGSAALYPMSL